MRGDWTVVEVPIDCSGRGRGEMRGPAALRAAGLADRVGAAGALTLDDARIESPERDAATGAIGYRDLLAASRRIAAATAGVIATGRRPLVVGGCCSPVPGALAGASPRHPACGSRRGRPPRLLRRPDLALDDATRVLRGGADGCYDAELSDRWTALAGTPNGGYCVAVCMRALALEAGPPDPLCTTVVFGRRARPGPATVRTRVLRTGRRLTMAEAVMHQGGGELLRATACFADLGRATGRSGPLLPPPDLPAARRLRRPRTARGAAGVAIAERFNYRVAELPGWRRPRPTGVPAASSGSASPTAGRPTSSRLGPWSTPASGRSSSWASSRR